MNITLLIGSLTGGGAERVVCNLANYLAKMNHEVTILTVSGLKTYNLDRRVRHRILFDETHYKVPHLAINLIRIYRMNKYFRKEKMDVYLTFPPKLSKITLAQRTYIKCPVILAERCDPETFCNLSERNKKSFEKYYPLADGYVFQTEDAKEYYSRCGINVENSVVIPNAVNAEFMHEIYRGKRRKVIVGAGRLSEQKNFSLLIDAFSRIHSKHSEYSLIIYGEGVIKYRLEQQVEELGLRDVVSFPGYVDNLGDMIEDASLFVLSSNYEGMPNVLMEAMALGLPVISTDCPAGGAKFLIKDGENGRLVPVGNSGKLAEAMDKMLCDYDTSIRMGDNARKICDELQADKVYGEWEVFVKETCNMFKRCL